MKKKFVRPSIETCEYVVAARLEGSGVTGATPTPSGAHDAGIGGAPCAKVASNGRWSCGLPSAANSGQSCLPCW